jgi:hypothetical protein
VTDIDALTLQGSQLLTGRGAPFAPHDGIRALMRATDLGGAEAPVMLATLAAMGSGLPQSWPKALELLGVAAARGSRRAQGQILALCEDPPSGAEDWVARARRIDVARWTASPDKTILSESPRVRLLKGFVSPQICTWLIGVGRGQVTPALVYDQETGAPRVVDARNNSALELSIVDLDLVAVLLRTRIAAATGIPVAAFEPPQILHYDVGQKFDRHYDFLDASEPAYAQDVAQRGQRIITFLLYLNEDYEGGQTEFPKIGLSVKGKPGDAVMFANVDRSGAPDYMTLHAGAPPTSGEKWLLSQWIRDRAPPPVG